MVKNRAVGDFSLPPGTLCINPIVVHDFSCPIPDTVHLLYPLHLILCLEQFGDTQRGSSCFPVIKSLSIRITKNSRHSKECLLFQAIQDNSAHFESKSASLPLAK